MDPIGWGLERYEQTGAYRTVEPHDPNCLIDGEGEVSELGTFSCPGELGRILADSAVVNFSLDTLITTVVSDATFVFARQQQPEDSSRAYFAAGDSTARTCPARRSV